MVGIVDYVIDHADHAFISLIMVAPAYRGKGIDRELVQGIEDEVRKSKGCRTIMAAVQINNAPALGFWRNLGYEVTDGEPVLQPDQTTVCFVRKEVSA